VSVVERQKNGAELQRIVDNTSSAGKRSFTCTISRRKKARKTTCKGIVHLGLWRDIFDDGCVELSGIGRHGGGGA